ncbi:MAG: hypothetical protein WCF26_01505 [Candidatus Sulfotelmatobacter sp.]
MVLGTVFGKVNAHVEFLHTGADGIPLAQAFAFVTMDEVSSKRFKMAAEQMYGAGISDVAQKQTPIEVAFETLRESVRLLSGMLASGRRTGPKPRRG